MRLLVTGGYLTSKHFPNIIWSAGDLLRAASTIITHAQYSDKIYDSLKLIYEPAGIPVMAWKPFKYQLNVYDICHAALVVDIDEPIHDALEMSRDFLRAGVTVFYMRWNPDGISKIYHRKSYYESQFTLN